MKRKRHIRRVLRKKYNVEIDGAYFKWFPEKTPKRRGSIAIYPTPPSLVSEIDELKSLIEKYGQEFATSQEKAKVILHQNCWKTDYYFFKEEGLWNFDAYKKKVAVEILGRNIDEVFKDCMKFLLAFEKGRLRIGVIVVPYEKQSMKSPDAISVDAILHRFNSILAKHGLWILRASPSTDRNCKTPQ